MNSRDSSQRQDQCFQEGAGGDDENERERENEHENGLSLGEEVARSYLYYYISPALGATTLDFEYGTGRECPLTQYIIKYKKP